VSVGPSAGPAIVVAGVVLVVVGLLVWSGALAWFGRLPGDIRIQRDTVRVSIPIVSMLVVSAVLSLLLYVVRRWR
jgi:NAD/NADP transhydrogenase beta subunit